MSSAELATKALVPAEAGAAQLVGTLGQFNVPITVVYVHGTFGKKEVTGTYASVSWYDVKVVFEITQ